MDEMLTGALAGCAATVPMTWTMDALHGRLPRHERDPPPPRKIAMRLADRAGVKEHLDEDGRFRLTLTAHFGMGTAAGALYGLLGRRLPLPAPLAGAAFGLAVWAGNYLGLLPALGLLRPATRHPPRRAGLMIAAHLVWGAATGTLLGVARAAQEERSRNGTPR